MALQELGIVLATLGLAGTMLICGLPMWKVTAFIGTRLVVMQAARGLVCISLVLGCLGFLVFLLGARCTKCLNHPRVKTRVVLGSGLVFGLAGLSGAVAVSWTANNVIRDFYNPRVPDVLKRELGAAIYIGFVASGLLLCGGGILCASRPPPRLRPDGYTPARTNTNSSYAIKNYV
ncbi:claudin-4-like isoform 2-T2 [Syngnathus typhle]